MSRLDSAKQWFGKQRNRFKAPMNWGKKKIAPPLNYMQGFNGQVIESGEKILIAPPKEMLTGIVRSKLKLAFGVPWSAGKAVLKTGRNLLRPFGRLGQGLVDSGKHLWENKGKALGSALKFNFREARAHVKSTRQTIFQNLIWNPMPTKEGIQEGAKEAVEPINKFGDAYLEVVNAIRNSTNSVIEGSKGLTNVFEAGRKGMEPGQATPQAANDAGNQQATA